MAKIFVYFKLTHKSKHCASTKPNLRLCAYKVVSERFHNSQNENNMNYKNSDRMKFLVFVRRRGLCWDFFKNYVNKSGAF